MGLPTRSASNPPKVEEDITKSIVYEGASLMQLKALFNVGHEEITRKMATVPPTGFRQGKPIWKIGVAAPFLVKPQYDVEQYIKSMHPNELPKMLTKEYWAGQRSKQEFLLKNGDLWPTAKVVENVGELVKLVKMASRLMLDTVDRQSELTPKQRDIITALVDAMNRDLHRAMLERFKDDRRAEEDSEDL